ncbi:hypothetical protein ASO20_00150 [Mycoplasma sp. (ex Biomphalaria glabrata)]|uniref:hypothetical protein n=1 Tax=Mycoplasma sp. (ex Biomphalaria glabrata) TaxID=1749074 RepID=UPI00073A9A57|nr:hypothetical protein [Mycoplasma sp. (ex Biomphalaria glabrata)]ALV23092.1 hypothetical protein ASO20_00150 [Mycoplasma sp. (ex Biomphalaria glabrata)]
MNRKLKLFAIFSTLTTTAIDPISKLAEPGVLASNNNLKSHQGDNILNASNGEIFSSVSGENPNSNSNTDPFRGYIPSNFGGNNLRDNSGFTTIKSDQYVVVPYWVPTFKRPHFDSFATYSIDPSTKELTVVNKKVSLGFDVSKKIVLKPQIVGEDLVTFFRDSGDSSNPYGTGLWSAGVTNLKSGDSTTYVLSGGNLGQNTIRNISIYYDNTEPINKYKIITFTWISQDTKLIEVYRLINFDPRNPNWTLAGFNVAGIDAGFDVQDVDFVDDTAIPKHDYSGGADPSKPLLGWKNLYSDVQAEPFTINFTPYKNTLGYWTFKSDNGTIFINLGDNGTSSANLDMGVIDSKGNATATASFQFPKNSEYEFYSAEAITFSFFKGHNDIYYLFPSGVMSNTPDAKSIPRSSRYFAFNIENDKITNLESYDYNTAKTFFSNEQTFSSSKINYIASTGKDIITLDLSSSQDVFQRHFRNDATSPLLQQFTTFFSQNLFFVDLTALHTSGATAAQKAAIENIATWLGKKDDFSFSPMTISDMTIAATSNLPTISQAEYDQIITDFVSIQNQAIQTLLNSTYDKWIITLEGTSLGHQWGWYNETNLPNMFPTYVLDTNNGLIFDKSDNDISNPKTGLQRLINEFKNKLTSGTPIRFIDPYFNIASGSSIEMAFNEFKNWSSNQLNYYITQIFAEFNTFYYGFADINSANNTLWNYYIDQNTSNPISTVNDLKARWVNVMTGSSWNGKTALNLFISSKIWNNISVSIIAGKDANTQKFPFGYTVEFQAYKDINLNSFNGAINDLYDTFLKTEYLGYPDPAIVNKFDVSAYFSGSPSQLINKTTFINLFTHTKSTYNKLSTFYSWTAATSKYNFTRVTQFTTWKDAQLTNLQADFQSIINLINNSYYGYAGLTNNKITNYLLIGQTAGTALNSATLAQYFIAHLPTTTAEFPGPWATKSIMDPLKNAQNSDVIAWTTDQKTNLTAKINEIIGLIKDSYYGWITKTASGSLVISDVDKLLVNFTEGTELTASGIIATFSSTNLPTGLTGLWGLKAFVEGIDTTQTTNFSNNQSTHLNIELQRILDAINPSFFGYNPSSSLLTTNTVAQVILYGQNFATEITLAQVLSNFKNGIAAAATGFPSKYAVSTFLESITSTGDIKEFNDDQKTQLTNQFTTIINWISPNYYGFDKLADNNISKYILMGQVINTELNPTTLAQYFITNFPTGDPNFVGKWSAHSYFNGITQNGADVTNFVNDQKTKLTNSVTDVINSVKDGYYGWITKTTTGGLVISDVDKLLVHFTQGTELTASGIIATITSTNLPTGVAGLYLMNQFLTGIDSTQATSFKNNETKLLTDAVDTIINTVKDGYYGWITKTASGSLVISDVDKLLVNFTEGTELTASGIIATFSSTNLPTGLKGLWELKEFTEGITVTETNKFKTNETKLLTDAINTIINGVKDGYYGWITKTAVDGLVVSDVDKLLVNFTEGTELTASGIIATFSSTSFPTGLNGLWELKSFTAGIDSTQFLDFKNNQDIYLNKELKRIVDEITPSYYGYAPSSSLLTTNDIAQVILHGYPIDIEIILNQIVSNFKNGIAATTVGFPSKYAVSTFLEGITTDGDIKEFNDDQKSQLQARFTVIINWISSSYYGFEKLADNNISKYILMGQNLDTALDSTTLTQYFITNFPTSDPNFVGKWSAHSYFNGITQNGADVTAFINDQNNSLSTAWTTTYNLIEANYFGYMTDCTSLISTTILLNVANGTQLNSATLFTSFKNNVVLKNGGDGFPHLYELHNFFDGLNDASDLNMNEFIQEQNTKFRNNVDAIRTSIREKYWGYGETSIPQNLLDSFFDSDQISLLTIDNAIIKITNHEKNGQGIYHIYTFLKGITDTDLTTFNTNQTTAAKSDLTKILSILNKYYFGYEFDVSPSTEVFVGSKHIALMFNMNGTVTNGVPTDVDTLYTLFGTQVLTSDLVTDAGKDFTAIAGFLKGLYTIQGSTNEPIGELLNYKTWSELQLTNQIASIAQQYNDNYYGYATGADLTSLNLWFGTQAISMLTLDELKTNMWNYAHTLSLKTINSTLTTFGTNLGTSSDLPTGNTILARDLRAALADINSINQSWRNNYFGIIGYTGTWYESKYSSSNNNWSDVTIRSDLEIIRSTAVGDGNKFMMEYIKIFANGSKNLIDFKTYQDAEMSKILQPIVDFYNQWYMGYTTTQNYLLETTDSTIANGWVYSKVLAKLTTLITKNNDTRDWESQYIHTTYDSLTKENNFRDEQMNALVLDINDNLINTFFKNNYYGYNVQTSMPQTVRTIIGWQTTTALDAIWDIATWSSNNWTNTSASTYKIFQTVDSSHATNLKSGIHFKTTLSTYMSSTPGTPGADFINFQNNSLTTEVTSLISSYQAAYFGYTSMTEINSNFLPGMVKTANNNVNWVLNETLTALKADPGNYQNVDRVTNGKWLHNSALDKITTNLTQDDNFTAKENTAFDADITNIINEYKPIFRGFINDVNGNRLTYKTLGGDNAITNGVYVRNGGDITSDVFNTIALKTYIHSLHSSATNPTWEKNVISNFRNDEVNFKNEQTTIFRGYLQSINNKYSAVSKGYFATFNGSGLNYPNLPGWVTGPTGASIDIDISMNILDKETYNLMTIPDSSATYRLSYDAWKKFSDNLDNFANEQSELSSKDLAATEKGFKRQTEIFNFLADSESNKSWKTQPNYRGNYQDLNQAKQALAKFLNQAGNPTSAADLNDMTSQWFSLTQGDDNADWNNVNMAHSFMFFGQYGAPLQLIYQPTSPKLLGAAKISGSIIELNSGQHLLNGDIDTITFSPTSQDGNVKYGSTLVITKGVQQFTYKIIPSNNIFPFDQLLFTVADMTTGTPEYNLAQKITIVKNLDTPNSTENSVASVTYDKLTFDFANESPNYDGTSSLPMPAQQGINTITSVSELHHTIKAVRDTYIQIAVGNDLETGRKIRTNISLASSDYNNQVLSIDEVISRLPNIVPPSETSSLPSWVIPVIIAGAAVLIFGPTGFFVIRKIRAKVQTGKTVKGFSSAKEKQERLKKAQKLAKNKNNAGSLFYKRK